MKRQQLRVRWRSIFGGVCMGMALVQASWAAGPIVTDADALAALKLDDPALKAVKAAADAGDMQAAKEAYLKFRRTASQAKWMVMPADMPKAPVAQSDALGDEVCNHIIRDPYNKARPPVDMGKDFDWRHNPLPRSSPDFTNEWTFCAVARTFFWKSLAAAYWKTHDEKYAREWVAQLNDFTTKNPSNANIAHRDGSLWRTLDSSERMNDSWPDAYYHFLNSPSFTPEAQWVYLRSIIDHGRFLRQGLQDSRRSGNWVTSECYGLYAVGALFPELKEAESWRDFAMQRLAADLDKVVPPDGFEAELTPNYHYFTLSSYVGPLKLARMNNLSVPSNFSEKMLAMIKAPLHMMDQRFRCVATNDSGDDETSGWARLGINLFGNDPVLEWAGSSGKRGTPLPNSTMLPYAGFYAMRSGWQPDDFFLFFRAGPTGMGHEHEDMLQIVLRAWGKSLLIEPGSYDYDRSDWRRYAIGTASHNTVIVDGKWQHRGPSAVPVTQPVNNPWVTTPVVDYVAGTYDSGYQLSTYDSTREYQPHKWVGAPDRSVSHTRHIVYLRPYYALVLDTLDGTGSHTYDAHFHMDAPAARVDAKTLAAYSQNKEGAQVALFPLDRQALTADVVQGQKDPLLGWVPKGHRAIPTVRYRKVQEAPAIFATLLYPYRGEAPAVSAEALNAGSNLWAQAINTPHEQAVIAVSKDKKRQDIQLKEPLVGQAVVQAAGLTARKFAGVDSVLMTAWDLTSFENGSLRFTTGAAAELVWSQQKDQSVVLFNAGQQPVAIRISHPFTLEGTLPAGTWMKATPSGLADTSKPVEIPNQLK